MTKIWHILNPRLQYSYIKEVKVIGPGVLVLYSPLDIKIKHVMEYKFSEASKLCLEWNLALTLCD